MAPASGLRTTSLDDEGDGDDDEVENDDDDEDEVGAPCKIKLDLI